MTIVQVPAPIRCPTCDRVLGVVGADGLVVIRHHGRTVVAVGVVAIICEDCRSTWRPQPDDDDAVPAPAVPLGVNTR